MLNSSNLKLLDKGGVFGWGNSEYNQLNLATSEMQLHTPRHLPLSSIYGKIVDIATTGTSCLILNGYLNDDILIQIKIVTYSNYCISFRCWTGVRMGVWNSR